MYKIYILVGLLIVSVLGLILRLRRIIRRKNRAIFRQIIENDRLEKRMERISRKNIVLHDILKNK